MASHVYKLGIIYPEGSHEPGWRPAIWSDPRYLSGLTRKTRREMRTAVFSWPRERMFLSASGAYGRAWLLRAYGCEVEVLRSDPVTWPAASYRLVGWDWAMCSPPSGLLPEYDLVGLPVERMQSLGQKTADECRAESHELDEWQAREGGVH